MNRSSQHLLRRLVSPRLGETQEAVKTTRVSIVLACLWFVMATLSGCGSDAVPAADFADDDPWNRAGMKVAARASSLRHQFDDASRPDTSRAQAARELMRLDPEFLAARYDGNAVLIRQLIEQAVAAKDTTALALLARLFETRGGEERIDFALDLAAFGDAARGRLVGFLQGSDRGIVVRAADALAKAGVVTAAADIGPLLSHPDDWIRMGAAHALGQVPGPQATDLLLAALSDSSYAVVNAALVGLAAQKAVAAHGPAMTLLQDARPEVRKHAAHLLGQIGGLVPGSAAAEALEQAKTSDPDPGVRFLAGRALQTLQQHP